MARYRQVVGWGHRGFGGSGTDNGGTMLRTGESTLEVAGVSNDKLKENAKDVPKDEMPDKIREQTEDQCPPLQFWAGELERHKHCRRIRRNLMRIVS